MTQKPSAQGTLATTPFAHLLLYTQGRRLSGTLAIWPDTSSSFRGQDRVLFKDGGLIAMRPMQPAESMYMALLRLFRRQDAPYGFYESQNLLGTGDGLLQERVDMHTLLARGLRDHAREDVMEEVLGKFSRRAIRIRAGIPLDKLELNMKELAFIDTLRAGPATPEDLIAEAELSSRDARRLLYLLTLIRGVEAAEGSSLSTSLAMDSMPPRGRPAPAPSVTTGTSGAGVGGRPQRILVDPSGARPSVAASPSLPATPLADYSPPAPPVPAGLSPADDNRWIELSLVYERLDDITHFELLKVAQSAPTDQVSAAYYALVKKFHPDRLGPALKPLERCAQLVFERLTEAHETLTNAEHKAEYVKAVAAGGGTRASERALRNVLESVREFQMAEVLVRRRDYAQAREQLLSALHKNPEESDYLALYAWVLNLMAPTEPAPFDEMLRSLDRALRSNPRNERAHFYKGTILKRMKRDSEAFKHFRAAVEINPRNVDAAREVRIAHMRRDSKAPPGQAGAGLLSRLFGNTKPDE